MKKTKKKFCVKSSGFIRSPKSGLRLASDLVAASVKKPSLKKWRLPAGFKLFNQITILRRNKCAGSFHEAFKYLACIAQFFGVMPVCNILTKCPLSLNFKWLSLKVFYSIFVTLSCLMETVCCIYWTFSTKVLFGKMVTLVFYITNLLSFITFIQLSTKWPRLMAKWHEIEKKLPHQIDTSRMYSKMRTTTILILSLSAIEHILSIISSFDAVMDCPKIKNIFQAYFVHNFPQIFTFFRYSHLLGVYVKFIHITSTFVWSFADLFIMMISCGLASMFYRINEKMREDKGKVITLILIRRSFLWPKAYKHLIIVYAARLLARAPQLLSKHL